MNPVVRAQLQSFADANPSIKYDEATMFEVFSVHSVLNGLLSESIDPFKGHLQSTEFGIDGLVILIQGDLCGDSDEVIEAMNHGTRHEVSFNIFQSKTGESLDYGEMSKFFDGVHGFFTDEFHNPSSQLQDLLGAKNEVYKAPLKTNPSLRLFYITTGTNQVSPQIQKLIDATSSRLEDLNIFNNVEIKTIGAKTLQEGFRSATNSISQTIEFKNPITLPDHPQVQQAFLGYLRAAELIKLATNETSDGESRINRAVFFDNVRDFNEASEINKSILDDLKTGDQASFVFKNNGVTVVAKEVTRKGDDFTLDDYQIVNGCQTSNILFIAGEDSTTEVHVPFRLIESQDPDFVSNVIVGTNKQNEVKEDQFWALKPFMKDLEEYARQQQTDQQIFIERREHQYRQEAVERTRIIKPSDLVKTIAALFLFQPHRAARDYRGIRKDFSGIIFQDDHLVVPYYAAAYLNYKLDFAVRNKRVPREWGIYKYYVLSMIGMNSTGEKNLFEQKRKTQEKVCGDIIDLAGDEQKLVDQYTIAAELLDAEIKDAGLETREKVRDYIRSESVAELFKSKTLPS